MRLLIHLLLVISYISAHAQFIKAGQWRGDIHYDDVSIPFTFEIGYPNGELPEITFINGSERRLVTNISLEGDSLLIRLDPFDVEIKTSFTAMQMDGVYKKYYRDLSVPFSATYGKPRMTKRSVRPSPIIEERWAVTLSPNSSEESKAVGLFKQQGNRVTGTLMTEVSDYRYFEGILDGDSLMLSSFDGAHAFAFAGKQTSEGWVGDMIYDNGYSEPWTGFYDAAATLADPWEIVQLDAGVHKPYYDLLGAGQGNNAIDPDAYASKVLVIQLFGTWCPNSLDQTNYLVEWYNKHQTKDVAILAASFEANYTQAYGLERLEAYRKANEIPYDLVLGGRLSKAGAAMPFPFMKRIEAFPTLVILDKQGYARYVCSYFNGPATGEYYQAFDKRFNEVIEDLVKE